MVNYIYHYISALIFTFILWTSQVKISLKVGTRIMHKNQIIEGEIIA
jgi:hypothetical protein